MRHLLPSYPAADQWDSQPTIVRICDSLQRRGYLVWIDLEMMKGSVRSPCSLPSATCCASRVHVMLLRECHLLRISFEYPR